MNGRVTHCQVHLLKHRGVCEIAHVLDVPYPGMGLIKRMGSSVDPSLKGRTGELNHLT